MANWVILKSEVCIIVIEINSIVKDVDKGVSLDVNLFNDSPSSLILSSKDFEKHVGVGISNDSQDLIYDVEEKSHKV